MSTEAIYVKVFLNELKQVRRWRVTYHDLMEKLMRIMGTSEIDVEYMDSDLEWVVMETNDEWKVASSQHLGSEYYKTQCQARASNASDRSRALKGHCDWFSEKLYVHDELHSNKNKGGDRASKSADETLLKPLILRAKSRKGKKGSLMAEKCEHVGKHSTSCAPTQKNAATSVVSQNVRPRSVYVNRRIPIESIVNQARSIIIDGSDEAQYVPVVSGKISGRKIDITQAGDEKVEMKCNVGSGSVKGNAEPMSSKVHISVVQDESEEIVVNEQEKVEKVEDVEDVQVEKVEKVDDVEVETQIHTFEDLNESEDDVQYRKAKGYQVCESYILENLEHSNKRTNYLPEEAILQSMGFTDKRLNLHLLNHHKGSLDKVVNNLLQLGVKDL